MVGDGRSAHVHDSIRTADGGYLLVGGERRGGNYPGPHQATVWKVRANGSLVWTRTLAGNKTLATAIAPTDTGFVVAGVTGFEADGAAFSARKNVTPHVWRLGTNGTITSTHRVAVDGFRFPEAVVSVGDGVVLAGIADGLLVDGNPGQGDGWIARVGPEGGLAWEHAIGGPHGGQFQSLATTASGVAVVGTLEANQSHPWVLTLRSDGTILTNRTVGNITGAGQVVLPTDGGDLIVGGTASRNWTGDREHEYRLAAWRVTPDGTVVWSRRLANSSAARATSLLRRTNGHVVVAGEINNPGADAAVIELEMDGTVTGVALLGGQWPEYLVGVHETGDDRLVLAGYRERSDFSHIEDLWLAGLVLTGEGTGGVDDIADRTTTTTGPTSSVTPTTSGDSGPGFGVLTAAIAALLATVLAARRGP
ncbi:MAG: hypothetical protein ABEJ57_09045 [Halobacteriaceae archaeon]